MSLQTRLTALTQAVGADIKSLNGKVLTAGAIVLDTWHVVGAAGEAAFQNGWVNYGSSLASAAYRKDPFGKVKLRGTIKNGTVGGPAFALPVGYRPPTDLMFPTGTGGPLTTFSFIQIIAATGAIYVGSSANNGAVELDQIEFDTESVTTVLAGPKGDKGDAGAAGAPGGNALVPMDPWHTVGNSGEPAFENGWVNYNTAAYLPLQFRKDPFGKVQMRGMVKNGSMGASVFTLPAAYRPPAGGLVSFMSYTSATTFAAWQVDSSGKVSCYYRNDFCDAAVVEFDTDTVTQAMVGPQGPKGDTGAVGGNAVVPMDTWHQVATTGEPAFLNGWSNYSGAFGGARFRKYPDGRVRLAGTIKGGASGSTAFILPVGYRPAGSSAGQPSYLSLGSSGGGSVQVLVDPGTGEVKLYAVNGSVPGTFTYLDGVEFDTETVTQYAVGPAGPQGPVGGNATVPMDPWHQVGNSGEPAFTNGWVNDSPAQPAKFRKYPDGKVRIEGRIKVGNFGTAAFTLPVGYRPAQLGIFPVAYSASSAQGSAEVRIGTDGTVSPFSAPLSTSPGNYLALDGIEFDTETVTQFAVGPQGPQGPSGGFTGLVKDLDGINWGNYAPFRSKLGFAGANVTLTDGGPDDGFGGGDFTIVTIGGPTKGSGPLPTVNVREGAEYDLVVATGLIWRFRYTSGKWVFVGGPPLTFGMKGENNAYFTLSNSTQICVNASGKVLQWQITPLVDVWVDVEFWVGLMQKTDAAYHYIQMSTVCNPGAPITLVDRTATRTQHASVQQFEPYAVRGLYGLSAGVAYSLYLTAGYTGGGWQYHQASNNVNMIGKAWPR